MSGLFFVRRLSGKWLGAMMTYAFPLQLLCGWLTRSLMGTFTLVSALWLYRYHRAESKPWTAEQMAMWISELDGDLKGAILTAMLTIIGFTVAFQTAAEAWKTQALGQLKLQVADEIEKFFGQASSLIIDMDTLAGQGVKAYDRVLKNGLTPDTNFSAGRFYDALPQFVADREKLSRMAIDVHALAGRNSTLLMTIPSAQSALEEVISALDKITDEMWVPIPTQPPNPVNSARALSEFGHMAAYRNFEAICEKFRPVINGLSGGIVGMLRSVVIRPNFTFFLQTLKNRKAFVAAFSKLAEAKKP